jgi:hypothetical protein
MLKRYCPGFLLTAFLLAQASVLLSLLTISPRRYGFDYGFFIPRLFEGVLSFRAQGLVPPYYSSFLCGGFPLYADPQSMFYSLPQFLSFIVDPWRAIEITAAVFLLLGGYSAYFLARRIFTLSERPALTAAIFFAANGFYRSRMLIGHLSFHTFMLIPVLAAALLYRSDALVWPVLIFSAALALMFQGGAHYVVFIALISSAMVVLLCFAVKSPPERAGLRAVVIRAIAGLIVGCVLSASKIEAARTLMRAHPRIAHFDHALTISESARLLYVQLADPLAPRPLNWGIWEYDCSLSPMVWPGIILALVFLALKIRPFSASAPIKSANNACALAALLFSAYLLLSFSTGEAAWLPWLRRLPIVHQMRLNMRFTAALILPFCLVSAMGYAALEPRASRSNSFGIALVALAVLFSFYAAVRMTPAAAEMMSFDGSNVAPFFERIMSGAAITVQRIGERGSDDFEAMVRGEANPACYTAIWAHVPANALHAGPVNEITRGAYNLINPSCYWFPRQNGCKAGALVAAGDRENFENLLAHRNPDWNISSAQRSANILSVAGFGIWCAGFLWHFLRIYKRS